MACCLVPPGPQGPLKTGVQQNWPARQTGIMGMTQPKRRFTSSTQSGGHSGGGTWRSCSMAPLPEPAGQPGCRLGCLPEAPSQGCRAQPLLLRRDALPARPAVTLPPAWPPFRLDPRAQLPSGPGPGLQRPGRAGSLVLGKVTPGQCSLYLTPAPPLPRAWGCSCLRPCSLQLWFRFQVLLGGGAQWHPPPEGLCVLVGSGGLLLLDLASLVAHRTPD